jgi:hypothetical protein
MKWFVCFGFILLSLNAFGSGGIASQNSKSDLLSIEGCKFIYDGKVFYLDWPINKLEKVLGSPEQLFIKEDYKTKPVYMSWEYIGITIRKFQYEDGDASVFVINLVEDDYNYFKWYRFENGWSVNKIYNETPYSYGNAYPYKGFYLDGMKVVPGIGYKDFLDMYDYDLDDFVIKGGNFRLNRLCDNGKTMSINIGQGGGWTYKGSGHLMYKDKYIPVGSHAIRFMKIKYE